MCWVPLRSDQPTGDCDRTMTTINLRTKVLLSLQAALLDEITPNIK